MHESSQQTHLVSGGKIVLEANTEITLKVGGSFIRITPGTIFTSSDMVVGGGSAGSGASVALNCQKASRRLNSHRTPSKILCLGRAASGGLTVKPNEDE